MSPAEAGSGGPDSRGLEVREVLWSTLIPLALADEPWKPLRVAIECEEAGRIDACTLADGLLAQNALFLVVPRGSADVVLYINVTDTGAADFVFLRAVGSLEGAPGAFQQLQEVDSGEGVEEQQAHLAPGLWRTLAPYVSIQVPEAVQVSLTPPAHPSNEDEPSRAWGLSAWAGGWGSYSPTFQELSVWSGTSVSVTTEAQRFDAWVNYSRSIERQPSLDVDGALVSLSTDSWEVEGSASGGQNLTGHWSVGGLVRAGMEDPEGQYAGTGRAHALVEYNAFGAEHPRGNVLAASYMLGGQVDAYHQTNVLGEDAAVFPTHGLFVMGALREDQLELSVDAGVAAELLRPDRRSTVSGSLAVGLQVGDHVELRLRGGATLRAIPGPAEIDTSSFEEVTRASYAEPFQAWSNLNLRFFWDPTNGARNNRLEIARNLDPTGSL